METIIELTQIITDKTLCPPFPSSSCHRAIPLTPTQPVPDQYCYFAMRDRPVSCLRHSHMSHHASQPPSRIMRTSLMHATIQYIHKHGPSLLIIQPTTSQHGCAATNLLVDLPSLATTCPPSCKAACRRCAKPRTSGEIRYSTVQ